MRFSIASTSAVVLMAVGFAAAVCTFQGLNNCIYQAKMKNGGQEVGDCGEVANERPFTLDDFRTLNCVRDLARFYGKAELPSDCNDCGKLPGL